MTSGPIASTRLDFSRGFDDDRLDRRRLRLTVEDFVDLCTIDVPHRQRQRRRELVGLRIDAATKPLLLRAMSGNVFGHRQHAEKERRYRHERGGDDDCDGEFSTGHHFHVWGSNHSRLSANGVSGPTNGLLILKIRRSFNRSRSIFCRWYASKMRSYVPSAIII